MEDFCHKNENGSDSPRAQSGQMISSLSNECIMSSLNKSHVAECMSAKNSNLENDIKAASNEQRKNIFIIQTQTLNLNTASISLFVCFPNVLVEMSHKLSRHQTHLFVYIYSFCVCEFSCSPVVFS